MYILKSLIIHTTLCPVVRFQIVWIIIFLCDVAKQKLKNFIAIILLYESRELNYDTNINNTNLPDHKVCNGMVFHQYELTYEFQDDVETWKHKDTTHIYNIFHLHVICNVPKEDNY